MFDKFFHEFDCWRKQLHECSDFASNESCCKFEYLLECSREFADDDVVSELLKTFSDVDDFGLQENTRGILEGVEKTIYFPVLLRELDGIARRSPKKQWHMTLIGVELYSGAFSTLIAFAEDAPGQQKTRFFTIINSDEFIRGYPEVKSLI
jgi:hypothetical protein